MIMSYKGHDSISLKNGVTTILETNNRQVYSELILGLQGYNDKIQFFDDEYKKIDISKAMDWDGDIVDSQNLIAKYNAEIVNTVFNNLTEEQRSKINECEKKLYTVIQDILFYIDLPLEVTYDGDIKKVLKNSKIHMNGSISMDPYAIIETDLKIHMECNDKSCIGLSNVANYLNKDQLQEIISLNKEIKTSLLLIEFSELKNRKFYDNCDYHYIDEDYIDWHY